MAEVGKLYAEMNLVCEREEKDHLRHGVGGLFFVDDGKKWGWDVKNMEEIDGDSEFFLNFAK